MLYIFWLILESQAHVCSGESLLFVARQIEQLRRCEIIKESEVKALCAKAR